MSKPLIYIAALRRTGSTLLCELLSSIPYAFIFNEPNFADNLFVPRTREREALACHGVDLVAFSRRWSGVKRPLLFRAFRKELLPQLQQVVAQVGVKEIFHKHWRRYLRAFPDMRIVLTARDPRDIYISLYHRHRRGEAIWEGPFGPREVAASLNAEFLRQQEMAATIATLKVRYEDLCLDPTIVEQVKLFTESEVPDFGEVGAVTRDDPRRSREYKVHGDRITDQRVARWRREEDPALRRQAEECHARMPEYGEYWGYRE